ncbi:MULTISPECIES: prenyltransferase/squalene oxidase repeat-containing protein [unclassified Streptomyces]|uniref:prenyltransferase/squalene oxidase repeat-containing protein n=1 Tax=unclassified Streptomyces TaxID=2593676 RepID=UPI002E11F9E1|nr:terpene cyclase/mutase family protein [Streptomyces sp. NBC_01241]WSP65310.1 terpene cyclase/mutase family protein [Streptomyces sp. NBC_01240]
MTVRRRAATLAATATVLCAAAAPVAIAAPSPSPSPSAALPSGLYGTKDPTYDGVWRQSLAFLAQRVEGVTPAAKAVDWLIAQQCSNGAYAAYRPDVSQPCTDKTMLDTNATAAAVQALVEVGGHRETVNDSVRWLKSMQNEDGGWGYAAGAASDANSTSLVIGALARQGQRLGDITTPGGKTPYDPLLALAIPCGGKDGGAFAYQPDKAGKLAANADATAAAVLGTMGKALAVGNNTSSKAPSCHPGSGLTPEQAAQNGAHFLAGALATSGHLDLAPMPGAPDSTPQPDFGNTADAVVALSAAGHQDETTKAMTWLKKNSGAWAEQGGPAAYAQLILAAHAAGADARHFGGVNLVDRLNATGPAPAAITTPDPAADTGYVATEKDAVHSGDDVIGGVWWYVGIGLVVGAGAGFLISGRRKNQQL